MLYFNMPDPLFHQEISVCQMCLPLVYVLPPIEITCTSHAYMLLVESGDHDHVYGQLEWNKILKLAHISDSRGKT